VAPIGAGSSEGEQVDVEGRRAADAFKKDRSKQRPPDDTSDAVSGAGVRRTA
jgi:hypothetical protein